MIFFTRLTVVRETPNKGRQFYGCSKSMSEPGKCTFFLWADEQPVSSGPGPSLSQFNNRAGTQNNFGRTNNSYRANSKSIYFIVILLKNLHKQFMFVDQSNSSGQRKCGLCKQPGK